MHRREAVFLLRKLLVAGGDGRMLRMARMLAGDGFAVSTLGLVSGDEKEAGIASAEALLFPYPVAVRDGRVPTLTGLTLHPEDVLESARPDAVLLAGAGLGACLEAPETRAKRFRLFLYESSPTFLDRNADLSAEGALVQAMGRTGDALPDMTVLVTGYGRFGRALAAKLKTLGADVWVAACRQKRRHARRVPCGDACPDGSGGHGAQYHSCLRTGDGGARCPAQGRVAFGTGQRPLWL